MHFSTQTISAEHASAIAALSNQMGYATDRVTTERRIQQLLEHPEHCGFVAISAGKVIGWIHAFYTFRLESDVFTEIGGLSVDPAYKRQGAGRQLIEQVKRWSLKKGVQKIRVRCNTNRPEAHEFYKSLGFQETKSKLIFDTSIL